MNELALFMGGGGGILASELLGWRIIAGVEYDAFCARRVMQRQNEGYLPPFPIWDDVRTFDGRPLRNHVDIVSGGFPCQAYSTAASGKNNADDLWPEMRRVVADVAPGYVWAENVSREVIDAAADDLEEMGYKTSAIPLSAADLGADHIRERYWLLAYADDKSELLRGLDAEMASGISVCPRVWQTFPDDSRVDDGVANRMDRYKATGNGQIPAVVVAALVTLCLRKEVA